MCVCMFMLVCGLVIESPGSICLFVLIRVFVHSPCIRPVNHAGYINTIFIIDRRRETESFNSVCCKLPRSTKILVALCPAVVRTLRSHRNSKNMRNKSHLFLTMSFPTQFILSWTYCFNEHLKETEEKKSYIGYLRGNSY